MVAWLIKGLRTLCDWYQAAQSNAAALKQSPTPHTWLAWAVVLFDFALVALWFRYVRERSLLEYTIAGMVMYLIRLVLVTALLLFVCRSGHVSGAALGFRRSTLGADFRWAFRICIAAGLLIAALITILLAAAWGAGIALPPPPALFVQVLGDHDYTLRFLAIAGLGGFTAVVLAPLTEELIYRAFFLPVLTARIGLIPAVLVNSLVFGLAHVLPAGQVWVPVPEIIGGLLMAASFSIRWSVVPAMVVHALGNLFAGVLVFGYVRLFQAYPALFA